MGMPPPIHFRPHGGAGEGNEPGHLLTKDQFAIVPTGRYRDKEVPRFTQPTEIGSFSYTEQRQFVMDDSQLKYYYPPDLSQNHNLSAKYEEYITRASVDEHIDALLDALIGIKDREEKSSQESSPVVEKGHEPQSSDRDTIAVESSSTPSHSEATKNPSAPSSTKADFICYRGILTKIMCTPYEFKADWELRATRFNGTIYIEENFKEEKVSKSHGDTERSKLMSYWGYRFETISCLSKPVSALRQRSKSESDRKRWKGDVVDQRTKDETNTNEDARVDEDGKDSVLAGPMLSSEGEILGNSSVPDEINRLKRPLESDGPTAADSGSDFGAKAVNSTGDNDTEIDPEDPELIERLDGIVNTNIQYCTVVKTKIGRHSIVMGAEVDCITEPKKPGVNPVKNYVELKTTKLNTRQRSYPIHSMKLLKFWAQSFLVGIPMIVVGCRDDDGNVTKIEQLETNQIPRMVRTRHDEWQWSVCVTFLDNVLTFLQDRIADDDPTKTYLIRKGIMSDMVEVIPEPPGRAFLTDRFVGRWSEDGRTTLSRGSN
ncbi:Dom-3 Z [Lunasporangiospora selenospora]|uniref:Decapping nuclease n=1 Tax=Lunasporangiospora selenospora TaxID=979761 RepID=A0A9P6FUS9_9FUNG|nr:Dom-3 Z [Lunasporangiospora selenospora]